MFNAEERKLRPSFEEVASEMYGGDVTKFMEWTEDFGGEYKQLDVNVAFRAFVEGYRLGVESGRD